MLENVPLELRERRQWVVWRAEVRDGGKPTKVPYQAHSRQLASTMEPSHWASFDEARAVAGFDGIGFVFTRDDPFCGIDLDHTSDAAIRNVQNEILQRMYSYSELSPSGLGMHIIVKATVESGLKQSSVEIYSWGRFFTFTGNVAWNLPIAECQGLVTELWNSMRRLAGRSEWQTAIRGEEKERMPDEEILQQARTALNGAKFEALYNGNWTDPLCVDDRGIAYPSQSEADFALVDILQFHSGNRDQIMRLFLKSNLARDKHHKRPKLVNYMIDKSFDREPPGIDLEKLRQAVTAEMAKPVPEPVVDDQLGGNPYIMPPDSGLLAALADFMYRAAPRPVPEIALTSAIGFLAGICGAAYNVRGAGVNLYLMLLAPTGSGKEAMASGMSKIAADMSARAFQAINQFRGPGEIASSGALYKAFKASNSFVSVLGEFGYRLQEMSDDRNAAARSLRRALLEVYGKSGAGNRLDAMAYSDQARNEKAVDNPAFTLICESTQHTLFNVLDERMVEDGLLPRFLLINYEGQRPPANEFAHLADITDHMRGALGSLVTSCLSQMERKIVTECLLSAEAEAEDRAFDLFCDSRINSTSKEAIRQLWSRAHLKVRKLASLAAIGKNPIQPTIERQHYLWAKAIVVHSTFLLLRKFEQGEIGARTASADQNDLIKATAKFLVDYVHVPRDKLKTYRIRVDYLDHGICNRSYLLNKAQQNGAFRRMKFGTLSSNVDNALKELIGMGYVDEVNVNDPAYIAKFGLVIDKRVTAKLYAIKHDTFDELKALSDKS